MAEFPVNPSRFDPYKDFKFRVKWDGQYVAGVSRISALRRTTEVVEHREASAPSTSRKSPGLTRFDAIILERGVTQDTAFEAWANKVWKLGGRLDQNLRSPISAKMSSSNYLTKPANWCLGTTFIVLG